MMSDRTSLAPQTAAPDHGRQPVRILVVTQDPGSVSDLTAEIMRRSALVTVTASVPDAGAAVRLNGFEAMFVSARAADAETALLIQLLRGASLIVPKVYFLTTPDRALDLPLSAAAADATISLTLPASEIADFAVPRALAALPQVSSPQVAETLVEDTDAIGSPSAPLSEPLAINEPVAIETTVSMQDPSIVPAAETIARAAEAIARAAETIAARNLLQTFIRPEDAAAPRNAQAPACPGVASADASRRPG